MAPNTPEPVDSIKECTITLTFLIYTNLYAPDIPLYSCIIPRICYKSKSTLKGWWFIVLELFYIAIGNIDVNVRLVKERPGYLVSYVDTGLNALL